MVWLEISDTLELTWVGEYKESWRKKKSISHVFKKKNCFKEKNKPAHWVGPSKLGSLDIDEFFKRTQRFDENQDMVTGNTEE